jgi:hypothetical protein
MMSDFIVNKYHAARQNAKAFYRIGENNCMKRNYHHGLGIGAYNGFLKKF